MTPRRRNPRAVPIVVATTIAVVVVGFASWYQSSLWPKRFAVVDEGRLYRSGEVSADQLRRLRDTYGIERVICLLNAEEPVTQQEREAVENLGLKWENISLSGDGASDAARRDALRALLLDPDAPPTLVHCAAGVNRTGLAVGMYRIHHDGWTYEQVYEEMLRFDFDDLPKHENLRQALREEAARAHDREAVASRPVTRPAD